MRRLIHRLLLIAGCLFLAWVLLLLTGDVIAFYETESSVRILDYSPEELRINVNGFGYMINAFIFIYNRSGYYNNVLPYFEIDRITEKELLFSFVGLYILLTLILIILVIISKSAAPCYIISGGFLGIILLIGYSPGYTHLVLLVVAWLYLNLVQNFLKQKGERSIREFLHEFPVIFFPIYGVLLFFIIALPILIPAVCLPEADEEVKNSIFAKLQEIQLVSEQYDENKRKQEEELRKQQETEWQELESENIWQEESAGVHTDENTEEQERIAETESQVLSGEQSTDPFITQSSQNSSPSDHKNGDNAAQNNQELNGLPGLFASGDSGGSRVGFSLSSGAGMSGGRTDRTGNISFDGKTVLRAYADFKPEENLYIRLFYAEVYENNRWKQTEGEHFDEDLILGRSVMPDYNGDGEPDFGQESSPGFMEGFGLTDSNELADSDLLELTMPTFYALNSMDIDEHLDLDVLHIEYPDDFSKNVSFNCSIWNSIYYPEKDSYLLNTCREVPTELQELFIEEFSDVFQSDVTVMTREQVIAQIDQLLEQTAYYTLSPGKAPDDKDFVTWFLMENKRGYCMHFASAGVMMLREAGISARYAEGYFVPVSAWVRQEDGRWCAEIKDSNAHAWAEIYSENDSSNEFWLPVELTPAYNGELAGSFAGQPDGYVGRFIIPGIVIKVIKVILGVVCTVILAAAGLIIYKKGKIWYEYRMLHTGSRRQDVKNMTKLLLRKLTKKNRKVRSVLNQENLTQEEFKELIPGFIEEFGQDEEAAGWFKQFSDYAYKAAFGAYISKQERKEALSLYRKLRDKLSPQNKAV